MSFAMLRTNEADGFHDDALGRSNLISVATRRRFFHGSIVVLREPDSCRTLLGGWSAALCFMDHDVVHAGAASCFPAEGTIFEY